MIDAREPSLQAGRGYTGLGGHDNKSMKFPTNQLRVSERSTHEHNSEGVEEAPESHRRR